MGKVSIHCPRCGQSVQLGVNLGSLDVIVSEYVDHQGVKTFTTLLRSASTVSGNHPCGNRPPVSDNTVMIRPDRGQWPD